MNTEKDVCSLPKKYGLECQVVTRYYYSRQEGKCKHFTYGGCDGNANNFKTEEECKKACEK